MEYVALLIGLGALGLGVVNAISLHSEMKLLYMRLRVLETK